MARKFAGGGGGGKKEKEDDGLSEEMVRGVTEFLVAEGGRKYVDALVEDLVDTADSIQLTAGVAVSIASGGLVPPPIDKPSVSQVPLIPLAHIRQRLTPKPQTPVLHTVYEP